MNDDVTHTSNDISKELQTINIRTVLPENSQLKEKKDGVVTVLSKRKIKRWALLNNITNKQAKSEEPTTQLEAFKVAMKLLFILGKLIGLNPVRGISETNVGNIKFTVCYWRFLYCMGIGVAQAVTSVLNFYYLLTNSLTVGALSYFVFCTWTCATTFLFIQIGTKWSKLMTNISKCNLDEYIDSRVKVKCYMACVIFLTGAIIEHLLSINVRIVHVIECHPDVNMYEEYLKDQFPWVFSLEVPVYIPIGIILQIITLISTLAWNYSDLYIVCMSIYLASILEQINKKIISGSQKHYLPSFYWRFLREDYNRATQMVRSFDDVFSGIVFTSFSCDLFFICLQIFNILMNGVKYKSEHACPNFGNGPFAGYEYTVYLLFSITYLFAKSMAVSLIAASVNTASLVPAPALYNVPSSAFCDEVSRFITQVNGDTIALSGLQFFYVKRDLVLSVAGTIVTYELVLLQFSGSQIGK